jgi:hypothetical protein
VPYRNIRSVCEAEKSRSRTVASVYRCRGNSYKLHNSTSTYSNQNSNSPLEHEIRDEAVNLTATRRKQSTKDAQISPRQPPPEMRASHAQKHFHTPHWLPLPGSVPLRGASAAWTPGPYLNPLSAISAISAAKVTTTASRCSQALQNIYSAGELQCKQMHPMTTKTA